MPRSVLTLSKAWTRRRAQQACDFHSEFIARVFPDTGVSPTTVRIKVEKQ